MGEAVSTQRTRRKILRICGRRFGLRAVARTAALGGTLSLAAAGPLPALDLGGSLRIWAGPLEANGIESDQLDQRYTLQLEQAISPWLSLFGFYRYTSFRNDFDLQPEFKRTTSEPQLGFYYSRPTFSARVFASERAIRTTIERQDLDVETLAGDLDWRPSWGPRFSLRFQDTANTADPAVFGRDTKFQFLDFSVLHDTRRWSTRYTYQLSETENLETGFRLDQDSHELRATFSDRWWAERWFLSMDSRVRYLDQRQRVPRGTTIAQPIPAREGLFAVDTSPEAGELQSSPGLIDGDLANPVQPRIEIGGGNTFRNIGVDLGITRPISELEITVDRPSGALVLWQVYESPDNLNWFPVAGVQSLWDGGFLHYTIRFAETTNRFFKAVNVSPNAVAEVAVTEIRALVEVQELEDQQSDGTEYWLTLASTLQPHRRVELGVRAGARTDLALAGGGLGRERETLDYGAHARVETSRTTELRLNYRFVDLTEELDPVLKREEEQGQALFEWNPLTTVGVVLGATRRRETEEGQLIRSSENFFLRALTDLLPELRLISEWDYGQIDDPFTGVEQTTGRWTETLDARPTDRWTLVGSIAYETFDSTGILVVTERTSVRLRTSWLATPYLSLLGDWDYGRDNQTDTLTQRYGLTWSPGDKLSLAVSHQETASGQGFRTSNSAATATYRLNRRVTLWSSLAESTSDQGAAQRFETTTYRFGLDIVF